MFGLTVRKYVLVMIGASRSQLQDLTPVGWTERCASGGHPTGLGVARKIPGCVGRFRIRHRQCPSCRPHLGPTDRNSYCLCPSIGRLADTLAGAPTEFFCGTGSNFVAASGRHMLLLCLMRGALPLPAQPELA